MRYVVTYKGQTFVRTSHRHYTHAVIPVYTTRHTWVPSPKHAGLLARHEIPCAPYYGPPKFCGSAALARKTAQPGWIILPVTTA